MITEEKPYRVHFSCGAASAVSLLLAVESGKFHDAWYADTGGEHADNARFFRDIEQYSSVKINIVKSDKYISPFDVWSKKRFIAGAFGATCPSELKKLPLKHVMTLDVTHVFGFTSEEATRFENRQKDNQPIKIASLLIERNFSKNDCYQYLMARNIKLPKMYELGFNNANCIGCPKGGKGYWNHIRKHFPNQFNKVAELQQDLGEGSYFWEGKGGKRISLFDLKPNEGRHDEPNIECGLFCANGGL